MKDQVNLWTNVLIFLDENKDKHFTDNIFELCKKYDIFEKYCNCKNQKELIDFNGNCKNCKFKIAI
jgi:hypothetical protein